MRNDKRKWLQIKIYKHIKQYAVIYIKGERNWNLITIQFYNFGMCICRIHDHHQQSRSL